MGESNREAETRGEESESESEADADASASASASASVFPKEPSFSMWSRSRADAVTIVVDGGGSSLEEPDLSELPLLGGGSGAGAQRSSTPILIVNGDEIRHPPFDIETGLAKIGSPEESSSGNTISGVVVLKTLFCILAWYTFSTCLTVYNKKLLGENMGKFPAPMMMNTVHFTMQAVLSKAIVCFQSRGAESSVKMTWRDYILRVVPTGLGSALDINLSNASLVFISVTFATMCKSAAPIFLLLFAFAFRLERPSFKLIGIIIIISIGVLLTVAKETEFEFWGFVFVMLAAVMSGFRWCMTQLLLQREAFGLQNPIVLMSYVTPVMAVATAILSLSTDPWGNFTQSSYFDSSLHILQSSLLMLLGGALAFFMVLTEYILVSATSAVTVTVAGIVKEAVTIMVAVYYFHDKFTLLKGFGLFTIMVGVSLFNWYKYNKLKEKSSDYKHTHHASPTEVPKYVILDEDFHDVN